MQIPRTIEVNAVCDEAEKKRLTAVLQTITDKIALADLERLAKATANSSTMSFALKFLRSRY